MTPVQTNENGNKNKRNEKGKSSVITSIITVGALVATMVIGAVGCTSCKKNNINPDELQSESTDLELGEDNFNEVEVPVNVNVAESETELLMCLIASEAPYASDEVMTAIAAVVLNRVEETQKYEFPNSVTEVVYQMDQFESVHNGTLMTVSSLKADNELYRKTYNAVKQAQEGYDPTGGSLFFFEVKEKNLPFPDGKLLAECCGCTNKKEVQLNEGIYNKCVELPIEDVRLFLINEIFGGQCEYCGDNKNIHIYSFSLDWPLIWG